MKILSQRDLLWCDDKLGASETTVGKKGCTTTSISMLSDYFGCYKTPKEIAHNVANYIGDLINWKALNFEHMIFKRRLYGRSDVAIQEALKNPDKGIMLEVNNGSHWVVAVRKTLIGNSYVIADPWLGDTCDVIKRYKNITGAAIFERK